MRLPTWKKADLHIHTNYSDGGQTVEAILRYTAQRTDLVALAITDHNMIEGALEAQRLAPRYGVQIIVGEEVSTTRGHVLGLYLHEHVPAGASIPETVRWIHDQGGLAILAHPFDRMSNSPLRHWPRPTAQEWAEFGVDGIEALNGCQIDPLAHVRAAEMAQRLHVPMTGGSDAHHLEAIGTAYTRFPGQTSADLRHALERGACFCAGAGWTPRDYLGWLTQSWWPRTRTSVRRAGLTLAALHIG